MYRQALKCLDSGHYTWKNVTGVQQGNRQVHKKKKGKKNIEMCNIKTEQRQYKQYSMSTIQFVSRAP